MTNTHNSAYVKRRNRLDKDIEITKLAIFLKANSNPSYAKPIQMGTAF